MTQDHLLPVMGEALVMQPERVIRNSTAAAS